MAEIKTKPSIRIFPQSRDYYCVPAMQGRILLTPEKNGGKEVFKRNFLAFDKDISDPGRPGR